MLLNRYFCENVKSLYVIILLKFSLSHKFTKIILNVCATSVPLKKVGFGIFGRITKKLEKVTSDNYLALSQFILLSNVVGVDA